MSAARSMWKHRWLGLLVAWGMTALGALVVLAVVGAGAAVYW
eukprot:gene32441-54919_t